MWPGRSKCLGYSLRVRIDLLNTSRTLSSRIRVILGCLRPSGKAPRWSSSQGANFLHSTVPQSNKGNVWSFLLHFTEAVVSDSSSFSLICLVMQFSVTCKQTNSSLIFSSTQSQFYCCSPSGFSWGIQSLACLQPSASIHNLLLFLSFLSSRIYM